MLFGSFNFHNIHAGLRVNCHWHLFVCTNYYCYTYTYHLTSELQFIACLGASGLIYIKNNMGVTPGTLVQAKYWHWGRSASLYGLSSCTSFNAWIMLAESFTEITWVYWNHIICLIMTDYTVQFGQDSALAHPLLYTEEKLAILTNIISGSITAPS